MLSSIVTSIKGARSIITLSRLNHFKILVILIICLILTFQVVGTHGVTINPVLLVVGLG